MELKELLGAIEIQSSEGELSAQVKQIDFDSRKVAPGSVFVAIRGTQVDGHNFIGKAIEQGAAAIVAEQLPEERPTGVAFIQVADSATALGRMASRFFGEPSRQLKLVGVTGTNGKTTTATLLHELFTALGYKAGLLSTVRNKVGQAILPAAYTTPDAVAVQALLREMVDAGCDYAFMEVSSHAAHQKRIEGLYFAGGIFTNITHDHLDYHKTFQAYIEAKKMFFDILPKTAFALVNIDDKRGGVMVQNTRAKKYTYSLQAMASFRARLLDNSITGLHLDFGGREFFSRLIGEFNAYNLLAVFGAAILLGQDEVETLTALSQLGAVEGRFDYVAGPQSSRIGIVDYAHTPDALEKVLSTIHQLRQGNSQIITVVGCGGDRDRAKRPRMAKVACDYSDQVVLTSDNPRSEDPDAIIAEMQQGIPPYAVRKVLSITSRKEAIRTACRLAREGDIILVAGKGHEKYQEIKGVRHPFDDKEELVQALAEA
ncbi:MAG: UDP-N-acetylmuramoyl-L-alanyl-D-glutamate--2,6-diaminopimelate ligase [Lewinellaceae bacterium]|nr:UDP-N-acetylmuramoyl-L-alanyl-D-glutamate--2,6-diaminopimelate ligase [Lewinellaceae bacterium]